MNRNNTLHKNNGALLQNIFNSGNKKTEKYLTLTFIL